MTAKQVIEEIRGTLEESIKRKSDNKAQAFYLLGLLSAYYEINIISEEDYKKLWGEVKEKLKFTTEDFDSITH
jgi:hypothetical protein